MPFKSILQRLVEKTPRANGALLADWEGEAVEHYCLYDDYELKLLGAHKGIILNLLKEIHSGELDGEVQHIVINSGDQLTVVAAVGPEYCLVMTMEQGAMVGLALHRIRGAVETLIKEIY